MLQFLSLCGNAGVELDDEEHDDYEHAETGVDDEGSDEEAVGGQEGVFRGIVVACVDGLDDGEQGSGGQDADCYLEDAPGGRGRDDCAHGVDEADVGGHYQSRRPYLLPPHLIARGGLAVEELDQSEEGEEEDGDADLDDGSEGSLEHRDVHDGIAVGVLERSVLSTQQMRPFFLIGMAILCEFVVIEDVLPAEEQVLDAFVGVIGIDVVLLLSGVMDFNVFLDQLVVAELGGVCTIGKGDFDAAKKGIILVTLELVRHDGIIHLLAIVFLHVQVLHCSPQRGISYVTDPELIRVVVGGTQLGHFYVHAVEPKDQLHVGLQGDLDGVQSGDEIEVVLLEGEEEDVGTQTELELPGHDEIAVNAPVVSELVFVEGIADGPVAVGHVGTQIILYIKHEVILEGHLQFFLNPFSQCLRKGLCLVHFFFIFGAVGAKVEGYVHRCHESAGEVLDVHFCHVAEVASHVGRDEGGDLFPLVEQHQRILAEAICPVFPFACLFESLAEDVALEVGVSLVSFLLALSLLEQLFIVLVLLRFHNRFRLIIMMMAAIRSVSSRLCTLPLAAFAKGKIVHAQKQAKIEPPRDAFYKKKEGKQPQMPKQSNRPKEKSDGKGQLRRESIDWKKYGREVSQVFQSKKVLIDIDLAFLAGQITRGELPLQTQLSTVLKQHIKRLKQANFSLLPQLVQLAFAVGLVVPPMLFQQAYIEYFRTNPFTIEQNQALGFPSYFLKRVALQTFLLCAERSLDEGTVALRFFCTLMSVNELKRADELCVERLPTMSAEQVSRFLGVFRQIRKRGTFVELSQPLLIEKQGELNNKALITTVISFLELGNREAVTKLEGTLGQRISGEEKTFNEGQVVDLLHILHKYKAGGVQVWTAIEKHLLGIHRKVPSEHLFLLMSGLTRNYNIRGGYLQQLIEADSTFSYAGRLSDKQFVQFFFVLYAHFTTLPTALQQKYGPPLVQALRKAEVKSVYSEIQAFFLFLFDSSSSRAGHLRKAYPDDTLLALLSIIHPFQNSDVREQQAYQEQLISRCGEQIWKKHRDIVVAEQFTRYKLVSTMSRGELAE